MDPSLLLSGGHALHSMDPAFILELGKNSIAFDDGDDFLQASGGRLGRRKNLHLPALGFREARVHAENLAGEKRGLVAASARADFQNNIFLVVGIFREQKDL